MTRNRLVSIVVLSLFPPVLGGVMGVRPARGGAWLQEPGTAYLRVSTGALSTRERFDAGGDRVRWDTSGGGFRDSRYSDLQVFGYAEIGIARGWNLVAVSGWSRLRAEEPSAEFRTRGFTDLTLGVKRALWTPIGGATSIQAAVTLPAGYDVSDYPALGSGVTEFSVTGQAGASTGRFWGNAEIEYRLRGGSFRNQVRGAIGGGWNVRPRVGLRGELRGGGPLGSTAVAVDPARFDPAAADPTNLDVAGTLSVRALSGLAVEGEVRGTLAGENTLAGVRWSLAVATSPAWRWGR